MRSFRILTIIHYYPIQWKLFLSAKTLESKVLKVLEQYVKQVSPLEKLHKDSSSPSVAAIKDIFIFGLAFLGSTCFHDI